MLQFFSGHTNLQILSQANKGQAAAINRGIHAARGKLVLFLDDDILCGPHVVAHHARTPRHERSCLAFGPVLALSEAADPLVLDWARSFSDDFFASDVLKN